MASPSIPVMQIEQVDCTMVRALSMALPKSLDELGNVLKLNAKKDKEGSTLMKSMCKPRKARKGEWKDNVYWIDDTVSIDRLHDYCDQDISTEIAAGKKVHRLKPQELKYWHLDQRMNDRGFAVDLVSARKLMAIAEIATLRANAKMAILTKGEVTAVSQAGAIATWVNKKGIPCQSIAKGEIESVLKEAYFWGHQAVIDVLELRQTAAKSSVAKITTLHNCVCGDGRVRGSIQFYGAAITGRDAGQLFQPQNLPRADADKDLPSVWKVYEILEECGNNVIQACDRIEKEIGPPMIWISKAIRSLIVAGPGKKLIGGDLSNIEGRGALWLAGDEEGLEKFRKIDAGLLPDVYILAYSEAFGTPVEEVTAEQRGLGKVITLACLAEDTRVLTDNGVKRIVDVTLNDKLWDGVEWVKHEGLVERGAKKVVNVDGIRATPDHLFLAQNKWQRAQQLVLSGNLLCRALETGSENLPSRVSSLVLQEGCGSSISYVPAAPSRSTRIFPICDEVTLQDATPALGKNSTNGLKTGGDTQMYCPTMRTEGDSSTESPRAYSDARTPRASPIRITESEESESSVSGSRTRDCSCGICSHSKDGTSPTWNLTESMSTGITSPETFDSSRKAKTSATNEKSTPCSVRSSNCGKKTSDYVPVFDILNAGPRSRFTVVSDNGFLISHNCGFQGGIGAFVRFATEKLLKSMVKTVKAAVSDEVWEAAWERFTTRRDRCELTRDQWTAIRITVDAWRKANPKIVQLWYDLERAAIDAVENPRKPFSVASGKIIYVFQNGFLWCRLPSGRALAYFNPAVATVGDMVVRCLDGIVRPVDDVATDELLALKEQGIEPYETKGKKRVEFEGYAQRAKGSGKIWVRRIKGNRNNLSLYGGRQLENCDQAMCRDIMFHAAQLADESGMDLVLRVHDELLCEAPDGNDEFYRELLRKCLTTNPHWLPGFPLAAKCFASPRYVH